jgi:hypothetical protein
MVQRLQYSLVITNISKRNNVTRLIEAGLAFGCRYILIVGQPKNFDPERFHRDRGCLVFDDDGDGGVETKNDVDTTTTTTTVIRRFGKWQECQDFLDAQSMSLMGVEIHPDAVTVEEFMARIIMQLQQQQQQHQSGTNAETSSSSLSSFAGTPQPPIQHADHPRFQEQQEQQEETESTPPHPLLQHPLHVALIMGNEGTGLSDKLMEKCRRNFVRIPQYGRGTASLNVYVAASIVLSQFYYYQFRDSCHDDASAGKEKEGGG